MLDRYWFGDVSRISPEAPVPVVKINQQEERLGGAANVANNVAALGAATHLLSVIGDDEAGRALARLAKKGRISAAFYTDEQLATVVKLRVIGRQQQLLRVDFEKPPSYEVLQAKFKDFEQQLDVCHAVLFSDYGKGGLTHIEDMIKLARTAGKPVFVDPKGGDYSRYRGANVLTPNSSELREIVGSWHSEEELAQKVGDLLKSLQLEALLLTRSENGMTLFTEEQQPYYQVARAREVFDVSGAGDTVIATLAVMKVAGANWQEATCYANLAAGQVVAKLGATSIGVEELLAEAMAVDQRI